MHTIDMQTWSRGEHFNFFSTMNHPHFSLCANVDITAFFPAVKRRGCSMTLAIVYVITRAANSIPEFRQRIREGSVIQHEVINPGFTILVDEDNFSFCACEYKDDFSEFLVCSEQAVQGVRANPWVRDVILDDFYYMTAIPWVSFTSLNHPMQLHPADSVPRFCLGEILHAG